MDILCTSCGNEIPVPADVEQTPGASLPCGVCGTVNWIAGAEDTGAHEEEHMFDAATAPSAAPVSSAPPDTPSTKKERSVLFKLGAMQGMISEAAGTIGQSRPRAERGANQELSGIADIRHLAHAFHADEQEVAPRALFDQIVAVPRLGAPEMVVPLETPKKGKGLMIALIVMGVIIVGALVFSVIKLTSGDGEKKPSKQTTASATRSMDSMDSMDAMDAMKAMDAMDMDAMKAMDAMGMDATGMDAMGMDAMAAMPPPMKPKKLPKKLKRGQLKKVVATVKDQAAACKKDKKGTFRLKLYIEGKTGKVTKVKVSGKKKRKSKSGKCLADVFKALEFPPFKRRRQTYSHKVKLK